MTKLHVLRPAIATKPLTLDELRAMVRAGTDRAEIVDSLRRAGWTQADITALLVHRVPAKLVTSRCQHCGADTSRHGAGRPKVWCDSVECQRVRTKGFNCRHGAKRERSAAE